MGLNIGVDMLGTIWDIGGIRPLNCGIKDKFQEVGGGVGVPGIKTGIGLEGRFGQLNRFGTSFRESPMGEGLSGKGFWAGVIGGIYSRSFWPRGLKLNRYLTKEGLTGAFLVG